MKWQFEDVGRSPLFQPDKIDEVLTYFVRPTNQYEFEALFPLTAYNTTQVEMDMSVARAGGMTPLVATGAESPIHGGYSRGSAKFEALEFREKVILAEDDILGLRKLGSKSELESAQALLQRKFAVIEERLANRLEWMRRQVLFDQQVSLANSDGVQMTVDYGHPTYLDITLTGTDLWSDYDDSDPLANLQEWVEQYMVDSGFEVDYVQMPLFSMKHLQQNDHFREALRYNRPAASLGLDQIREELVAHVGLASETQIRMSRGRINYDTMLTAASANGDTTLDLAGVDELVAGDTIYVARAAQQGHYKEKFTVDSISSNTVTVTSGVAHATGFAVGDPVRYQKYSQPLDKLLIVGRAPASVSTVGVEGPPDADKMRTWAEMATTLSHYSDLMSPTTGVFTKSIDKSNGDPPHVEQVLGIKALPKLNYAEGWMTAKIL